MMTTIKALLLGAAVTALPITASALTTFGVSGASNSDGANAVSTGGTGNQATVTFNWDTPSFSAYQDFSSDTTFDLFLTDYEPSVGRSQFVLISLDGPGFLYTDQRGGCTDAEVIAEIQGRCANIGETASNLDYMESVTAIFMDLAAGSYRIGFYEDETPVEGSAAFTIVSASAVPLPAGGALLLAALGGAGLFRRRSGKA